MGFCILECDEKTFNYFKKYVQILESRSETCFELDGEIQSMEIRRHLEMNGFSEHDLGEKINWIEKYGKSFREYLNTLKLAYVVWKCGGKAWSDITWGDFQRIRDELNRLKTVCLDSIF